MFWPFNIPAKRRDREAQLRRESEARQQRIIDDIKAESRRQLQRSSTITGAAGYHAAARQQNAATPASSRSSNSTYDDPLSPLNPLSPLSPINQASSWSAPAEEQRRSSGDCGSSSSHSHSSSDYSSSHSHSSHDHSCSSSSYDSSSSSSYDSGSSSSGSFD